MIRHSLALATIVASLTLAGCPGTSDPPVLDSGAGTDAGGGADSGGTLDAPSTDDTGPLADTGSSDGGGGGDTGPTGDAPALCSGGAECAGFPTTLTRGCTLGVGGADVNCAPEPHQIDCCGTMRVIGVNHGTVATEFCPAEALCRASYPAASCDPGPYMLDSGETTTDMGLVHVRCNIPSGATTGTCETYLGAAGGGVGGCGP